MKKIALSVIALAALSTVSFADQDRSYDDLLATQAASATVTEAAPFAATDGSAGISAYERQVMLAAENNMGRH